MSRSGNRSILVLLVSDEEPSLPPARDSQHSTPNTQTLIRDVVQPPALTSQQLLSHCQKTLSIFSTTTNSSPLQFHEGLLTVGGGTSSWIWVTTAVCSVGSVARVWGRQGGYNLSPGLQLRSDLRCYEVWLPRPRHPAAVCCCPPSSVLMMEAGRRFCWGQKPGGCRMLDPRKVSRSSRS